MANLQESLNSKYPTQKEKEQIKKIVVSIDNRQKGIEGEELNLKAYKNLEEVIINGDSLKNPLTKLELGNHPKLTRLNVESNQLTNLNVSGCPELVHFSASFNELSSLDFLKQLPHPEKLKSLNIVRNNFAPTTLDFLSPFTNLKGLTLGTKKEKIEQGIYNRFCGSLKPPKKLTELALLCIAGTDVDSGLEYLPLQKVSGYEGRLAPMLDCRPLVPQAKVKAIRNELRPFDYDVEAWQLTHPKKMLVAQPELFFQDPNKEKWKKDLAKKLKKAEEDLTETHQNKLGRSEYQQSKLVKRKESKLNLLQISFQKLEQGK